MKCFLCPAFCNSEIKQLSPLFLAIFLDIDLIFGMWVYNDQLQIKCMFRSDPMIFGRVMALGLWNLAKYLVVTTFFSLCLEILTWFFGIWVYNDDLQIKFTFRSGPMIFGRVMALGLWNLAKLSPLYFTMIWDIDLIFGMWVHSDELPIKFEFRSDWMILGYFTHLGLLTLAKYLVVITLFHYALRYWICFLSLIC
jgi:hypothetical protein